MDDEVVKSEVKEETEGVKEEEEKGKENETFEGEVETSKEEVGTSEETITPKETMTLEENIEGCAKNDDTEYTPEAFWIRCDILNRALLFRCSNCGVKLCTTKGAGVLPWVCPRCKKKMG